MPIKHFTKVFAVADAKIAPLLSDPEGGTPEYGPAVDVPGIKSVTVSGEIETKTLRGDNTLLDQDSVITGISVSFEYAKLSLDVLAAVLTAPVQDSGTTPDQIASMDITNTTRLRPFRFDAVSVSSDTIGGDVMLTLWKCVLSSFPELGMAEEDYKTQPLEAGAMPLLSTGKWLTPSIRETAEPLAV